jgi:hypothetical protein
MTGMSVEGQRKAELLKRAAGRLELNLSPAPQSVADCTDEEERELARLLGLGARIVAYAIENPESTESRALGRTTAREAAR